MCDVKFTSLCTQWGHLHDQSFILKEDIFQHHRKNYHWLRTKNEGYGFGEWRFFSWILMSVHVHFQANISTSDQRCFNVLDQRWNNLDLTLKMKQNRTSDFPLCTTLMQRWLNFISTLFKRVLNISKIYIKTNRASDKCGFVNS